MAEIDSLEVVITSQTRSVNEGLDETIKKMETMSNVLGKLIKNTGLENVAKKVRDIALEASGATQAMKGISGASEPIKKVTKSVDELIGKYADLGKGFKFSGSTSALQKQVDKYANSLENAKLKKEDLEKSGKTGGQAYEDAIKNVVKYENVLDSLKQQLSETQAIKPQLDFKITGAEQAKQAVESLNESIMGTKAIPVKEFNYNAEAMKSVFGEAAGEIKNYGQAVEQFGRNAGIALNEGKTGAEQAKQAAESLNKSMKEVTSIPSAEQDLNSLSSQMKNVKNMFLRMFADVRNGDVWGYLSSGVKNYIKDAQKAAGIKVYTDDYKTVLGDIERTEGALDRLNQKQRDMEAAGTSEESKEWQKLAAEISEAESRLESYIDKKQEMEERGTDVQRSGRIGNLGRIKDMVAPMGKLGEAMKGVTSKAAKLKNAIMNLQKQSNKGMSLGKMLGTSILFSSVFQAIGAVKQAIKEGSDNLVQYSGEYNSSISSMVSSLLYLKNAWAAAFSPIINVVAPYISAFVNMLASAVNKVGQFFAALTGKNIATQSKKVWSDYGASLTGVGKGASGAAKGLDKAAEAAEDFQTYTLGIDELNIQPQTDSGSKNSGGAGGGGDSGIGELSPMDMFETVSVENGISEFANKVKEAWRNADFTEIGSIVGIKLKSGLEAIPWGTIHETANKVGKSLATLINGFVEVDGLGYTLGEGIGQAYNTAIGLANSFIDNTKWVAVGAFIGEGANGAVDSVDWVATGHLLAGKWNAVFETAGEAIKTFDWSKLGESLGIVVNTSIADFKWSNNGAYIGEFVNGLFGTTKAFIDTTNWRDLGTGIMTSISSFLGSIDWGAVSGTISSFAIGIFDFLSGLIEGVDWRELPQNIITGISDFFGGIDYNGVFGSFGGLVGTAVAAGIDLVKALGEILGDIGTKVKDFFTQKFAEAGWSEDGGLIENGKAIVKGLLNGIWEGIKGIGAWVKEHIFTPFMDGFKKAFGIHSPSTVMAEQGGYIMQGLLNGISELLGNVISFFGDLWEKIKGVFEPVTKFFSDTFTNAYNGVKSAFSFINTWFGEKWDRIKDVFRDTVQFFGQKFTDSYNAIKSAFAFINTWFKEKWEAVKSVFNNVKQFFKEKFESGYNAVKTAFNAINTWFSDKWRMVKDVFGGVKSFFSDAFQNAYNAVTRIWDDIGGYFKGIAKKIIDPIKSAVNGVIKGINWVLEAVGSDKKFELWGGVEGFATGTNGLPQDTIGVVNDQAGSTYKELIVPPSGKPFIPEGRNVVLPMEKGTKIMPAKQTKALMGASGMPHFAGGIGDFLSGAWEAVKSFTGNVMDYLTKPKDILKIAFDKFIDISGWAGIYGDIASGAVNKVFDSAVSYIKGIFDTVVPKVDYTPSAGVEQWRQLAAHALKLTNQFTEANVNALLMQMQHESGGNPNAINNWDINAKRGTPSKGLMQVIDPTFRAYALAPYNTNVYDPLSNMIASIRYTVSRYGSLYNGWTARGYKGYASGIGKIKVDDLFPKYEVGGFPEDGLFMANHDEIVGRFSNGRTAVANDYQIEKGVEEATYRGYMRAHAETRETALLEEILEAIREGRRISIDGREIVKAYDSRKARMGYPLKAY